MRMTKDQAHIHREQQQQYGEKDIMDKFAIIGILHEHYGLNGLTGEIVMIGSENARCPDVYVKARVPPIAIELDGEIHGDGDDITKRPKDIDRDNDYKIAKCDLIIVNKSSTQGYKKQLVMAVFDSAGLKRQ